MKNRQRVNWWDFNESWECTHEFIRRDEDMICHRCKWVKYKIEIDAEEAHYRRIRKRDEALRVKNKHIDLFQF